MERSSLILSSRACDGSEVVWLGSRVIVSGSDLPLHRKGQTANHVPARLPRLWHDLTNGTMKRDRSLSGPKLSHTAVLVAALIALNMSPCTEAISLEGARLPHAADHGRQGERDGGNPSSPAWDGGVHADANEARPDRAPIVDCPTRCKCYYQPYRSTKLVGPLVTVNCSGQGLVEFPNGLPAQTQVLDMSRNEILNLTSLPRLLDLRVLDVSNNWLHYVDNRWLFEHVAQLSVLRLADNGLRKLQHGTFIGLSHLVELDISGNRLQGAELHAFADLRRLEVFRMDGNDLFHVERSWFLTMPALLDLRLSNNGLSTLDNATLRLDHLQHLDISSNRLRTLAPGALQGVQNLRLLNLSDNHLLREVPSEALRLVPLLDILLLDGLGLRRLATHAVSGLSAVELSLSYQPKLRAVGRAAFHNLTRLQTLQLHDCPRLAFLHPEAFSGVPRLRRLLIHNNALVAISERVVASLPLLGDLHVYHNPLRCDCNAYWLRKTLSDFSWRHYASVNRAAENTLFPNTSKGSEHFNSPLSSPSTPSASKSISSINLNPSGSSKIKMNKNQFSSIISQPGLVTCFFPDGASSLPLVQQPLQYFPELCPPLALSLFPPEINVSLGEPLDLECQGLGVPEPTVSWLLPHGGEINASTYAMRVRSTAEAEAPPSSINSNKFQGSKQYDKIKSQAQIKEGSTLHIPVARLKDNGTYRCRVISAQGQDFSSVQVRVQPKPLAFTELRVSDDYVTVVWEGAIPRSQMRDFQLFYRKVNNLNFHARTKETTESNGKLYNGEDAPVPGSERTRQDSFLEHQGEYKFVNLPGAQHTSTISGLEPLTDYEVCLVYRNVHPVQCRYLTTTDRDVARVVRTGAGIAVHVSKGQIGAGIGVALGALVLIWATLVFRRLRRRGRKSYQDYADPLREEKASIPLEGLISTSGVSGAPSTPLTSSRTALLTHSQI
ncbi:leucine-rich repeat neuronal protein 1 [Plakobranchus ocellatus]|uniref:Leucine-rich repeat neuronal protein 1 n=1 Tax=Plakobranchus ocellatus TaxID=259542 RepID=A0AAV4DIN5_9GAST|nr:leucine-rich repeat neuronal protein 1 [Plakobranchus ocellatus]